MPSPKEIANTIRDQIGINTLMCIGAHNLGIVPATDKILGGLAFKLGRNPKMKQGGTVMIQLLPSDTYRVAIMTSRGKMVLEQEDVYCDQLGGPEGVIERVTG
jgi:hypothetical protein